MFLGPPDVGPNLPTFLNVASLLALYLLLSSDSTYRNVGAVIMLSVASIEGFQEYRVTQRIGKAEKHLEATGNQRETIGGNRMLIPPNSFEAQVAETEPQDPSAKFENLSPTLSELAIQHSADVNKYPWKDYLVRKHSEGLDKEIVLTTANYIMHRVTKEAGEPVHERFFWYKDNFQTATKPSHPFSLHGKEELVAGFLVRDQINHELETRELDITLIAKYRDEISAEAMKEGDHSIHGAMKWMQKNQESRLEITSVPDRIYWQEYLRAWGNVFSQWRLDLMHAGAKRKGEVTDSGNEGET